MIAAQGRRLAGPPRGYFRTHEDPCDLPTRAHGRSVPQYAAVLRSNRALEAFGANRLRLSLLLGAIVRPAQTDSTFPGSGPDPERDSRGVPVGRQTGRQAAR